MKKAAAVVAVAELRGKRWRDRRRPEAAQRGGELRLRRSEGGAAREAGGAAPEDRRGCAARPEGRPGQRTGGAAWPVAVGAGDRRGGMAKVVACVG